MRIIASLLAVAVTVTSAAPFGIRIKDTESVYAAETEGQTLNADVTIVSQLSGGFSPKYSRINALRHSLVVQ